MGAVPIDESRVHLDETILGSGVCVAIDMMLEGLTVEHKLCKLKTYLKRQALAEKWDSKKILHLVEAIERLYRRITDGERKFCSWLREFFWDSGKLLTSSVAEMIISRAVPCLVEDKIGRTNPDDEQAFYFLCALSGPPRFPVKEMAEESRFEEFKRAFASGCYVDPNPWVNPGQLRAIIHEKLQLKTFAAPHVGAPVCNEAFERFLRLYNMARVAPAMQEILESHFAVMVSTSCVASAAALKSEVALRVSQYGVAERTRGANELVRLAIVWAKALDLECKYHMEMAFPGEKWKTLFLSPAFTGRTRKPEYKIDVAEKRIVLRFAVPVGLSPEKIEEFDRGLKEAARGLKSTLQALEKSEGYPFAAFTIETKLGRFEPEPLVHSLAAANSIL